MTAIKDVMAFIWCGCSRSKRGPVAVLASPEPAFLTGWTHKGGALHAVERDEPALAMCGAAIVAVVLLGPAGSVHPVSAADCCSPPSTGPGCVAEWPGQPQSARRPRSLWRVRRDTYFVADCRTVEEVARLVDLATLMPEQRA